ncbi:MAG TPA: TetR/AcrR family transcriptional regulator [Solirubrobacteraceae bacterium]|jgi:AcrR family transcriptional regulator|nr:TetR/AcrR family transcriptional regulator [Solirubrobacteraceae bacterium]
MGGDTRDRILGASAELMARQGYNGTGVKQIVAAAGAPFGSLYHFFPGGKEELGAETIRASGRLYALLIPMIFDAAPDLETGVRDFFVGAAEHLRESGWVDACPIATVALEVSSTSEPLRLATAEVFEEWLAELERRGVAAGLSAERARAIALAALAALEGAFVLCRSMRSTDPLERAGEMVAASIRDELTALDRRGDTVE